MAECLPYVQELHGTSRSPYEVRFVVSKMHSYWLRQSANPLVESWGEEADAIFNYMQAEVVMKQRMHNVNRHLRIIQSVVTAELCGISSGKRLLTDFHMSMLWIWTFSKALTAWLR